MKIKALALVWFVLKQSKVSNQMASWQILVLSEEQCNKETSPKIKKKRNIFFPVKAIRVGGSKNRRISPSAAILGKISEWSWSQGAQCNVG